MSNPLHSAASANWYTPLEDVERIRKVLGGVDLDPCTDEFGNGRIRAKVALYELGDTSWWPAGCSVYINPPGVRGQGYHRKFWGRLMEYRILGYLKHAIVAAYSLEHLQQIQEMLLFPICYPKQRVRWESPDGTKKSPTHASAYVYVTGSVDATTTFKAVFSDRGHVVVPRS